MKKFLLFIICLIFWVSIFSSQVDFTKYRQINLLELESVDYQVIYENENDEIIIRIIDGEVFYVQK